MKLILKTNKTDRIMIEIYVKLDNVFLMAVSHEDNFEHFSSTDIEKLDSEEGLPARMTWSGGEQD